MTEQPNMPRSRTGWWGWNTSSSWDDQGCLGCGMAWWLVAVVIVVIFGFWGWGLPGFGGWGGWGWRHYYSHGRWNCPPAAINATPGPRSGSGGLTNAQPPNAQPEPNGARSGGDAGAGGIEVDGGGADGTGGGNAP